MKTTQFENRSALSLHIRKLGRHPSDAHAVDIQKRRERLQARIDTFHQKAQLFVEDFDLDDIQENTMSTDEEDEAASDTDAESEDMNPVGPRPIGSEDLFVESSDLLLPSTLGITRCSERGLSELVSREMQLRTGQANDALQGIRIALGHKSFLFRTQVRLAKSKVRKTRAWGNVNIIEMTVRQHAQIYRLARHAMIRLGADDDILSRYKVLRREDLKATTILMDPSVRGKRHSNLAWFWSMDVRGDSAMESWMQECK